MAPTQKATAADAAEAKAAAEPTATSPTMTTETAEATAEAERRYDPRKMVTVYHAETGEELPNKVPETWLDGRFPQLTETKPDVEPKKEGK